MGILKKQGIKGIIISVFAGILIFCLLFILISSRTYQLFGKIISNINTNEKIVALTFDDGPAQNTEIILQVLKRCNISASFFLTGNEMKDHPELTKEIINAGHDIGNHSFSHKRMILKTPGFIKTEVEETDKIIRDCGFNKTIYFRPPYCKKFIYLPWYLKKTNRVTITWNIEPDSKPENENSAKLILQDVQNNIKPGSIILLHAMYKDRAATLDALPLIIQWLQQQGYSFVTINELIANRRN